MFVFIFFSLVLSEYQCENYWPYQYECNTDQCDIGSNVTITCSLSSNFSCVGSTTITRVVPCIYCWQLEEEKLRCYFSEYKCKRSKRPQFTTCTVNQHVECLGPRKFEMMKYCDEKRGRSFYITLLLSVFFGGFGADLFYLGYIALGFAKLLTLGGFGIWSILDMVELLTGNLIPEDGSMFMDFNP